MFASSDRSRCRRWQTAAALFLSATGFWIVPSTVCAQTASTPRPVGTEVINGEVYDAVTHKPVEGAEVRVNPEGKITLTDLQGQFKFASLRQGTHYVSASKAGYASAERGARVSGSIKVDLGAEPVAVKFGLIADLGISGHVLNSAGKPIQGITLTLMQRAVEFGFPSWQDVATATTDSEGAYRMPNLKPGSYILRTEAVTDPEKAPPWPSLASCGVNSGYATTYFGSAAELAKAVKIVLAEGEPRQLDFKLKKRKFTSVTVRIPANLYAPTGQLEPNTGAATALTDELGRQAHLWITYDNLTHSFRGFLPKGSYSLEVGSWPSHFKAGRDLLWRDGGSEPFRGTIDFAVTGARKIDLEISLSRGIVNVPLRIIMAPTSAEFLKSEMSPTKSQTPPQIRLSLKSVDRAFPHDAQLASLTKGDNPDLREFHGVRPGRYWVESSLSSVGYIASMTSGEIDLAREPLEIQAGVPMNPIDVVIHNDFATINVSFSPQFRADWKASYPPDSDYGAHSLAVLLVPSTVTPTAPLSQVLIQPDSFVSFDRVPPGEYMVLAFDGGADVAYRDRATLNSLEPEGKVIQIKPGERAKVMVERVVKR